MQYCQYFKKNIQSHTYTHNYFILHTKMSILLFYLYTFLNEPGFIYTAPLNNQQE